jgi:hypothetical protein
MAQGFFRFGLSLFIGQRRSIHSGRIKLTGKLKYTATLR